MTAEEVQVAIVAAESALQPADPRLVAVELDRVLAVHGTPANWDRAVGDYLEAFEDVPADLLLRACRHARLELKFFPKPAELRTPILEDLHERTHVLRRLRVAAKSAVPTRKLFAPDPHRIERTPEELATVERDTERARRILASAMLKPIPREAEDLTPDRADLCEALRRVREETQGMRRIPKAEEPRTAEILGTPDQEPTT